MVSVLTQAQKARVRIAAATVSDNSLMGLLQLRFEHDSATTRYEVFRALAYEIVYENQW